MSISKESDLIGMKKASEAVATTLNEMISYARVGMTTKYHQPSDNSDTNFLIDADLSILGAEARQYLEYTKQIRKEYQVYPDDIYIPGRKKVLAHFLGMEFVFKSSYFRAQYEDRARSNISTELQMLAGE